MAFVGFTNLSDLEVSRIGSVSLQYSFEGAEIHHEHPDYDVLHNNCQNWARYLVEKITGKNLCPGTISDLVGQIGGKLLKDSFFKLLLEVVLAQHI